MYHAMHHATPPIDVERLLAGLPARIDAIPRLAAARTPAAPALVDGGRTIAYGALVATIDRYAALLRAHGVRAGDRVLLASENCAAQVALVFAAAALDAWIVNVNARLTAPELAAIHGHSGARVALYTVAVSPEAAAHAARAGALPFGGAADGLAIGPRDDACTPAPAGPEPVAALVYTTGTTGQPKGVMLSHRSLLYVAAVSSRLRGLAPSDRAWGVLPVSHVYGLTSVMLGTLYAGACLHLAPRFAPEAMLAALRADGLTVVQGVPAMYARLLALPGVEDAPLRSNLRFAYAGGSPLDPGLKRRVEALLGLPLHNGYGLTEAAPTVAQTRLDAPRADTAVGLPIPGVETRLVDRAGIDLAPDADAPGILWVRGPNLMRGYYREEALTAAALRPGGWLDTGDMARRGPDGALSIVGRSKEMINRGGFNVYPLEVETALNAHPDVTQSAVVGRALADGDEEVVAFVQAAPGTAPDALRAWAAGRLAPYKRPARIVMLAALPAAPSGKVLKHVLVTMARALT
jgi:acyl-CoA synthetase (AMP-forming)/AMP-acid ligase II